MKKLIENKYPDGCVEIGKNINNTAEGVWKTYYPSGKIRRIANYKNGKKTGIWLTFLSTSNQTRDVEFLTYKNDKKEGQYIKYHPSHISCKGAYLNGKKQGQWYYYFGPNKILFKIENYNDDYLHGPIYTHFHSGELDVIEEYECGYIRSKRYFHKNQMYRLRYFSNNKEIEDISFHENMTYKSWTKISKII